MINYGLRGGQCVCPRDTTRGNYVMERPFQASWIQDAGFGLKSFAEEWKKRCF
jgi:hypothetical protein